LDVTNALKSDDMPEAKESYQYHEAGLSQQALVVETWMVLIPICRVL
jgi:hypothetical protein